VTQAASPHTHPALPHLIHPCLPLKSLASVVDSNATTTRDVQDFIAADILASRLVFIMTGGPTVPTWALILLSGTRCSIGYPDAQVPIDSPTPYQQCQSTVRDLKVLMLTRKSHQLALLFLNPVTPEQREATHFHRVLTVSALCRLPLLKLIKIMTIVVPL